MDTVAHVKFVSKNITRNGLVSVESKEDVPMRAPHRSVTFVQLSNTDAVETVINIPIIPSENSRIPSQKKAGQTIGLLTADKNTADKVNGRRDGRSTGLQTSAPFSLLDADFPPLDNNSRAVNQISSEPSRKDRANNDDEGVDIQGNHDSEEVELPSIDEILASKLSNPLSVRIQTFSTDDHVPRNNDHN